MRGLFSNHDMPEVCDSKLDCHLSEKSEICFLEPVSSLLSEAEKIAEKWAGVMGEPLGN